MNLRTYIYHGKYMKDKNYIVTRRIIPEFLWELGQLGGHDIDNIISYYHFNDNTIYDPCQK